MKELEAVELPDEEGDISSLLVPVAGEVELASVPPRPSLMSFVPHTPPPAPHLPVPHPATWVSLVRERRWYDALGVLQTIPPEELRQRLNQLWKTYSDGRSSAKPTAVGEFDEALAALNFVGGALLDPNCRRVCDQLLCHRVQPQDADATQLCGLLRQGWGRAFPAAASCSAQLARQAFQEASRGDVAAAYRQGLEALAADPFNLSLIETLQAWLPR